MVSRAASNPRDTGSIPVRASVFGDESITPAGRTVAACERIRKFGHGPFVASATIQSYPPEKLAAAINGASTRSSVRQSQWIPPPEHAAVGAGTFSGFDLLSVPVELRGTRIPDSLARSITNNAGRFRVAAPRPSPADPASSVVEQRTEKTRGPVRAPRYVLQHRHSPTPFDPIGGH